VKRQPPSKSLQRTHSSRSPLSRQPLGVTTGRLAMRSALLHASALFVTACVSTAGPMTSETGGLPVLEVRYTTMGWMVNPPEPPSRCAAGWLWEQWHVTVLPDGSVLGDISDGLSTTALPERHLSVWRLRRLMAFIEHNLSGLPEEVGQFATDSDSGELVLRWAGTTHHLKVEGANEGAAQFNNFYLIVKRLESELHVQDPYC
jgi:hypothetical protein